MANIGDLVVNLDANTQGLESGIDRATKATGRYRDAAGRMREANGKFVSSANAAGGAMDDVSSRTKNAAGSFSSLRAGISRVAGVLAALGVSIGAAGAVRQIADFQGAMNGLAATSNATAEQMNRMEKQARELGAVSQFSAQQAAEGQRFLAQAGFEVNEILGATPGILKLAAAGGLDLASAADIASNVLGGMRLEVDQLNRVNDVLAATASRSNTNIQQLGQALSFAAPFAAGAGISIEEAAAAIGVMSDAGIQASRAGTGLVGTIRQLSKVTDTGAEVLERHGLSLADVNIEARGLGPVLDTLRGANLNTAEAIALFGSEAGAAAQVLVNDYKGGITDATGEAERMATQLEQGLGPAFKSLGSAASEAVLQMGDSGLAGSLEGLIRSATGVISVWNDMGQEWASANDVAEDQLGTIKLTAAAIEGMTAALVGGGGAIAAMAALTRGIGSAKAGMVLLNAVMRANPIGALVTVLGAAAGVLFTFREELGLVSNPAEEAREAVELLTGAIDELNESSIDAAMIAINAQMFELERRAREAREELESLDTSGAGALGLPGGATGAQARLQGELGQIGAKQGALSSQQEELLALRDGLSETSEELGKAGEGAKKITDTAIAAATAVANYTAANDDATDSVTTFANSAERAAQRLDAAARTADPRFGFDPDEGTIESRARARFEASAFRIGDPSVVNFGNSAASTSGFGTSSSAQEATGGSGRNLGSITINVKQDNGEDVSGDVQGEEAFLSRLAGALSSVSSAA